jgi:protein-L-isoaspartate O-methyltransferase
MSPLRHLIVRKDFLLLVTEGDGTLLPGSVPPRVRRAVEVLAVRPAQAILEIGGGTGAAASLICAQLTTGRYLGIDRSEKAVSASRQRLAGFIDRGTAEVRCAPLEDAALQSAGPFDTVFAINVNLFWTRNAVEELQKLARILSDDGVLRLFFEPPPSSPVRRIVETVSVSLTEAGFEGTCTNQPLGSSSLIAFHAVPAVSTRREERRRRRGLGSRSRAEWAAHKEHENRFFISPTLSPTFEMSVPLDRLSSRPTREQARRQTIDPGCTRGYE